MSSNFGTLFRISTFGESHCKGVGVVIDGCPPGMALTEEDIQPHLDRRRPGQSSLTTDRAEADRVTIISGTENGRTLGTPILLQVANQDQRPGDYGPMSEIPRPSHADYTYLLKYGIRASSGGGRSSARETIGTVAAGAVARKILQDLGIEIVAWVSSVGTIEASGIAPETLTAAQVDQQEIRCPDPAAALRMRNLVAELKDAGDSVGGIISCIIRHVPPGLGEPTYEKLEAKLAQAMLAIPASKGFEIGSGFAGSRQRGSEHNDPFTVKGNRLGTLTNNSGGVQGGISNGEPIYFRVAFKPPATIALPQPTVDFSGRPVIFEARGRHDPCVVPRAIPIVEAMAALVLVDMVMRQEARKALRYTKG